MPSWVSIRLDIRELKGDKIKSHPLVIAYNDLRGFETNAKAIFKYIFDWHITLKMPLTARIWTADDELEKFLSESGAYIQLTFKLKDNLDTKTYAEQILDILHSIDRLHCNLFIQARANNTNIFHLKANALEDYEVNQYTLENIEKVIKHRLMIGDIPKKSKIELFRQ
ncbi:hypothetical protein [Helicobacter sp.]|uniref:hypothetical protein n=1 Tax=Helicobacter sp. TaxID=218 RepID=UPI0019B52DC1|nr:hypothetical protein [Helicobacter sp.]MBD5165052.1 hypothetical protein [Helicobacter sp.]